MSQLNAKQPTYNDGRTKQTFRDETDINKILQRAQKTGTISHLNKHQAQYADFSEYDFFENTMMLTKGREIFDDLPSEIRSEFNGSPAGFFKYVNDPENKDRLIKLLPGLAAPGRQNIDVSGKEKASLDAVSEVVPSEKKKLIPEAKPEDKKPSETAKEPKATSED